jgi:hypothetical protein
MNWGCIWAMSMCALVWVLIIWASLALVSQP